MRAWTASSTEPSWIRAILQSLLKYKKKVINLNQILIVVVNTKKKVMQVYIFFLSHIIYSSFYTKYRCSDRNRFSFAPHKTGNSRTVSILLIDNLQPCHSSTTLYFKKNIPTCLKTLWKTLVLSLYEILAGVIMPK